MILVLELRLGLRMLILSRFIRRVRVVRLINLEVVRIVSAWGKHSPLDKSRFRLESPMNQSLVRRHATLGNELDNRYDCR